MVNSETIALRRLSQIEYHDPEPVLRRLRNIERYIPEVGLDERVRRLRTNTLKPERESRDAALFTYGIGKVLRQVVFFAPIEQEDYDFVTTWVVSDERHYCPVQLKEIPPDDLNPSATVASILSTLRPYGDTRTVLAVKLNRDGHMDLSQIEAPDITFAELWLFGATTPDQSEWFIYGDVLQSPRLVRYAYPE